MSFDKLDLVILKTLLSNRNYALEFINECNEKLFDVNLWRFAKLIVDYIRIYKQPPTKRVLLDKIGSQKSDAFLSHVEEILSKIDAIEYDEREFKYDLGKLKERYSEKLISNLKDNLTNHGLTKNISDIQLTLNNIKSVNQVKTYKEGTLKEYSKDFITVYNAKMKDPTFGVGVKTGYTFIDYINAGMRPGEFLLYAGITNSGKSLLLMNTAIQMWMGDNVIDMRENFKKGCNVLLFSLEMNYDDYMQRAISRISMVPQRTIRDASLNEAEKSRISKSFKFINSYNNYFKVIDLPRKATVETIELIINEQTDLIGKPDVVVIDYLNLMGASNLSKDTPDWLQQASLSEGVHELGRVKELIMLSAVQLNPKGGDGNGGFGIKDMRRASQISDNCDLIGIINTRKDEKNYPDFCVEIVKNRRGELASGKLRKYMDCCAILNGEYNSNENADDISGKIDV